MYERSAGVGSASPPDGASWKYMDTGCAGVLAALFLLQVAVVVGIPAEPASAGDMIVEGALVRGTGGEARDGTTPGSSTGTAQECRPVAAHGNRAGGEEVAVVDRVVDGSYAVLLVGPDQREWVVESAELPPGSGEGSWLRIAFAGGCDATPVLALDYERTSEARARIAAKLALLRQRQGRSPGHRTVED